MTKLSMPFCIFYVDGKKKLGAQRCKALAMMYDFVVVYHCRERVAKALELATEVLEA